MAVEQHADGHGQKYSRNDASYRRMLKRRVGNTLNEIDSIEQEIVN